jgi:hypothetical protein
VLLCPSQFSLPVGFAMIPSIPPCLIILAYDRHMYSLHCWSNHKYHDQPSASQIIHRSLEACVGYCHGIKSPSPSQLLPHKLNLSRPWEFHFPTVTPRTTSEPFPLSNTYNKGFHISHLCQWLSMGPQLVLALCAQRRATQLCLEFAAAPHQPNGCISHVGSSCRCPCTVSRFLPSD